MELLAILLACFIAFAIIVWLAMRGSIMAAIEWCRSGFSRAPDCDLQGRPPDEPREPPPP